MKTTGRRMMSIQKDSVFEMLPQLTFFLLLLFDGGVGSTGMQTSGLQARDVRQVGEVFRVIQPVTDQKVVRRVKADEFDGILQLGGDVLMQQRANLQRAGPSGAKDAH